MTEFNVGDTWTTDSIGLREVTVIGIDEAGAMVWIKWPDGSTGERSFQQMRNRFKKVMPFFEEGQNYRRTWGDSGVHWECVKVVEIEGKKVALMIHSSDAERDPVSFFEREFPEMRKV